MRRLILVTSIAGAFAFGGSASVAASCTSQDFSRAVNQAGADLRTLNADNTPRLQAKIRQLKEAKGWPDAGFEEKAYEALQDERTAAFDAQANELLAKIDTLGTVAPGAEPDCAKLQELAAASLELQATVKTKAAYTLSKLDQMLGVAAAPMITPPKAKAVAEPKPSPEPKAPPEAKESKTPEKKAQSPPQTAQVPAPTKRTETSGWSTTTQGGPAREVALAQPPLPGPPPGIGPPAPGEEEGYTIDEIKAASAGYFGRVSANLGSVIEHVFSNSGRPTGYVLGSEGGGAFLAGVRYGKGTLYMRSGGTQPVYWHGPSLGTDIGAEGSKTLFLIYKLAEPEQLHSAFTGIDGSAYLVGGVGATLMTNGTVIMAPIRSGMGLRLGANVGYIRFTPKETWNPF